MKWIFSNVLFQRSFLFCLHVYSYLVKSSLQGGSERLNFLEIKIASQIISSIFPLIISTVYSKKDSKTTY